MSISGTEFGGGALGSGIKVDSTSSLPRVCPPPEKKPRGSGDCALDGGPALLMYQVSCITTNKRKTDSAARRKRSLTVLPPGTLGLSGFWIEMPLRECQTRRI